MALIDEVSVRLSITILENNKIRNHVNQVNHYNQGQICLIAMIDLDKESLFKVNIKKFTKTNN